MDIFQGLLGSIYNTLVNVGTNYFRYTSLSFLIFWLILKERLTHFRIQPRTRTKAKVIFKEIRYSLSIIPLHNLAVAIWSLLTLLNSIVIHLGYEIYPQWFTKSPLTNWKTPSTHHNMQRRLREIMH